MASLENVPLPGLESPTAPTGLTSAVNPAPPRSPSSRTQRDGVVGIALLLYVYEDHSVVLVTRQDYKPVAGGGLRVGRYRLPMGHRDIRGLPRIDAIRLIGNALAGTADKPLGGPGR